MDSNYIGWIIAGASLLVNILQLLKNNELKNKITTSSSQQLGTNARSNQQTHSGTGHNMNTGKGDINVGKE